PGSEDRRQPRGRPKPGPGRRAPANQQPIRPHGEPVGDARESYDTMLNRFDRGVRMATIGDVAKAAGVSRSTASYALSGKRPISEEVRRRVLAAAEALSYTPNAGARALATSQTMVIGLLAQFHEDEFAPAMMQYILGVTNTARDLEIGRASCRERV